ncbi:glycoside hydrolase family 3 N-terminal domain-containing protein [Desulfomonile tiedjei]|nr:glycoside hydrolase family 3 N-terminal domain-containing protein [Desulfomonile tiedjei]
MKIFLAALNLLIVLALLPLAWDWRAPFLPTVRHLLFMGLVAMPLLVIVIEFWLLRSSRPEHRALRVLSASGLLVAVVVLITSITLEGHFRWVRHQVLHANPAALEKLGRHFIVGYRDIGELRRLIKLKAISGVFVTSTNVNGKSPADIQNVIRSFQNQRKEQLQPPLWIATDQEGGSVSRLSPPLSRLPFLGDIVKRTSDVALLERNIRQYAGQQGQELAEVGVNLNFAPVVDLNFNIINPDDKYTRIFQRAISNDPTTVAQVAAWYCEALDEHGVRSTLKHFPGLGRVYEDTHLDHADLTTSLEELTRTDWMPFLHLMKKSRAFVMLGHARLTAIDKERPVSMSPKVIAGLIRGTWKHDGVLITDNFSMLAVYRSKIGMDNGSIEALNAGVDLILISYDPDQYYRVMYTLLQADKEGKLDQDILKQSDRRLERAIRALPH